MRILLSFVLFILVGCETPRVIGPEFNEDTPRTITAGVTGRDEIRKRFGTPPTVHNESAAESRLNRQVGWGPRETWIYRRHVQYGSSESTLRIVFTNDIVAQVEFQRVTN